MVDFQNLQEILDLYQRYEKADQEEKTSVLSLAKQIDEVINKSMNKPPYQINLFDIFNIYETLTSKLISVMLKYKKDQDYILCRSFIERFLIPCGFNMTWYDSPEITAERNKIDVCIQERGKYAIIIENKLKGARFQRNQIARYIAKMRNEGYNENRIFIVILPKMIDKHIFDDVNKSVWRLPKDWMKPNQERLCAYSDDISCKCDINLPCEMCQDCETDLREKFKSRTIILDSNLAEWLEKYCIPIIPSKEFVLHSAIIQFMDFLNGIYNNRLNNKLIMELEQFLRKQLFSEQTSALEQWNIVENKKKEIDEVKKGINELQKEVGKELINEWKKGLSSKWGKLNDDVDANRYGFYLDIRGIKCGCWKDNEVEEPYWGFRCEKTLDEKALDSQKEIVRSILARTNVSNVQYPGTFWIAYGCDLHADIQCDQFYQAALELKYIS